jgi:hypothetical protein
MPVSMDPIPSPFVSGPSSEPEFLLDDDAFDGIGPDPTTSFSLPEIAMVRKDLKKIREAFPERSQFAVIDLDFFFLLSIRLSRSELHASDLIVLSFLLAHFDHRHPVIRFTLTEIANRIRRDVSQVRRSMRKLEKFGWVRFERRGAIELCPAIVRSANKKYRAIHFRHANYRFHGDR